MNQRDQENLGDCSRCVEMLVRNKMLGSWLFLMEFTTMRCCSI